MKARREDDALMRAATFKPTLNKRQGPNVAREFADLSENAHHRDLLKRDDERVAIDLPTLKQKIRDTPDLLSHAEIAAAWRAGIPGFKTFSTMDQARRYAGITERMCGLDGNRFVGQTFRILKDGEAEVEGLDTNPYDA
jgi:hypothetical protein